MSGEIVLAYLLANYAPLTAIVDDDNIVTGEQPVKTQLPGIGVEEVDSLPYRIINVNEKPRLHTDRVQVTAACKGPQTAQSGTGRAGVKRLLALVLAACTDQRGTVNGIVVSSIVPDIQVMNPYDEVDEIYSGSRDFIVHWVEN